MDWAGDRTRISGEESGQETWLKLLAVSGTQNESGIGLDDPGR